jgi:hypothetical protein
MTLYKTGLLIIRAWIEHDSGKPLRAHFRTTTDVSKGFDSEFTVTDVPATTAAVEKWLRDVAAEEELAHMAKP